MKYGQEYDWCELVINGELAEPVVLDSTDLFYIIYTSRTIGLPKGVFHNNG